MSQDEGPGPIIIALAKFVRLLSCPASAASLSLRKTGSDTGSFGEITIWKLRGIFVLYDGPAIATDRIDNICFHTKLECRPCMMSDCRDCRFNYSKEFLKWALHPPGYTKDWHVAIRVKATQKLVAFISAVPSLTQVKEEKVNMVDINFLCIHKKLRSKRLAPVLIKVATKTC